MLKLLWHVVVVQQETILLNHNVVICLILISLSIGRRASIRTLSNVIPRKDNCVEGPSTFSIARGMPSSWLMCCMDARFD